MSRFVSDIVYLSLSLVFIVGWNGMECGGNSLTEERSFGSSIMQKKKDIQGLYVFLLALSTVTTLTTTPVD